MGNSELFKKLCKWATEKLNSDKLNNKLLLAKDDREQTVLHHTSLWGNLQILERIWNWAKG